MKRTAIAVSMCFGMTPTVAMAFDWSLRSSQTETTELNIGGLALTAFLRSPSIMDSGQGTKRPKRPDRIESLLRPPGGNRARHLPC